MHVNRASTESLLSSKIELGSALVECFDDIKTRSIKEMTLAARNFFDKEAKFKGLRTVLTEHDQSSLLSCIAHTFDPVNVAIDVLVGKLERQKTEELQKQDIELQKLIGTKPANDRSEI